MCPDGSAPDSKGSCGPSSEGPTDPCATDWKADSILSTAKSVVWTLLGMGDTAGCKKTTPPDECKTNPDGTWSCPTTSSSAPPKKGFCLNTVSGKWFKPDGTDVSSYEDAAPEMEFKTCLGFKDTGKHPALYFQQPPETASFKLGYKLNANNLCYDTDVEEEPKDPLPSGYGSDIPTSGGSALPPCT